MSANKFTLDGLESFELEQKGRFSCCFSYRALVLEATALTNEPQPYCMLNTFFFIQFFAINKFRAFDDDNDDKVNTNDLTSSSRVFEDSFETLLFEMNHIMKNSTIGFSLKTALCFTYLAEDQESIPLTLFAVQLRLVLVPNIVHQNGQFKYLKFCIKYCFSGFR